jgi:glycosyltransferase involved in cell wall biosynthesis
VHVAVNGWFWGQPGTGSGQYVRRLVASFAEYHPDLRITLIVPSGTEVDPPGDSIAIHPVDVPARGHWAKLRFEQRTFPAAAGGVGADLAHVPYWGSPLRSPVPVVVTIHDLIPLILPRYRGGPLARLYTGLVAASSRGAAMVITDSSASQTDIVDHLNLPPNRVRAIHLAAGEGYHPRRTDLVEIAVRRKYDLPDRFVLYLGGYDVRKNVDTLLRAYTYVREAAADAVPLVLAGRLPEHPSPRFSDVPSLVESLNLADVIDLIGWVDEGETPALYRLASCFVYPSRYEGFGLPVLEAMACGTPVVAGDAASLPEIVGDAGFLVAPDDARAMAGAILATLNQDDLAAGLRQRGLERAAEFSWARTAAQTREVYEQALANSHS